MYAYKSARRGSILGAGLALGVELEPKSDLAIEYRSAATVGLV